MIHQCSRDYITYSQFFDICQNGDLMLFKSQSFGSLAVRLASGSEYDHIGLLIRGKKNEIYLYECIGGMGVQINSLEYFIDNEWEKLYSKIVIRKLKCERSSEFTKNFTNCCTNWLGIPYKISASKLFRQHSFTHEHENFFCSELVAAVYKEIGILPKKLSSCQYWPSSFSAKSGLELIGGAYLGEEMRILFEQ
jgi:Permuted papain-like amidase enzyme, YaeF/YiiX, C92 family